MKHVFLCFKTMYVDWDDIKVTGISGIEITMPTSAKVSIFADNDLTHINDNYFEVNLMARLLNQIYVVLSPPPRYNYYDDSPEGTNDHAVVSTPTGATATAPPFSFTL